MGRETTPTQGIEPVETALPCLIAKQPEAHGPVLCLWSNSSKLYPIRLQLKQRQQVAQVAKSQSSLQEQRLPQKEAPDKTRPNHLEPLD